jgi:hypothetical protein
MICLRIDRADRITRRDCDLKLVFAHLSVFQSETHTLCDLAKSFGNSMIASRFKWPIGILFVLGLCVVWVVVTSGPKPCPLTVGFAGFGMQLANPYYVFVVTNRSGLPCRFEAIGNLVSERFDPRWSGLNPYDGPFPIAATNTCRIITPVLPNDGAFRLTIACDEPQTKWDQRRESCAKWLEKKGLTKLGSMIAVVKRPHTIQSSLVKLNVELPWPEYYSHARTADRACWIASEHLRMVGMEAEQ